MFFKPIDGLYDRVAQWSPRVFQCCSAQQMSERRRRQTLEDLPDWPKYLSREEAARYLGVSVDVFDDELRAGVLASRQASRRQRRAPNLESRPARSSRR